MINLRVLNPQQRQAVETIRGPILILAGAGTGKTRVITHRIAHMVEKGIEPARILAVTFTNKAAREMQQRVRELVPKQPRQNGEKAAKPLVCTFHSLCVRILRQHIEKIGYKRNFVIYSESDQLAAVKKILSSISAKGEKTDAKPILSLLSKYKNAGCVLTGEDASAGAIAEHIKNKYDTALRACNAVDFDDLILLTLRVFVEHPEALEACRAAHQYVMVDEYQDTNASQFQLVHHLVKEHRNFCVVGDDDQSIYGWRGADASNLLDVEKHFPEVKVIKLEQNYRSNNTILNAANAVIKNNLRRRGKHLWSEKGQGAKIVLHTFVDDEEEARTVVEEIEYARIAKRIPWSEQAILFRTNIQARPLETALRKGSIRYHLIGGQSYFDRREVKDFLAYLKTLLNPDDDISLLRIANIPARGLSDETMEKILAASHERSCSVFEAMKNPLLQTSFSTRVSHAMEGFVAVLEKARAPLIHDPALALGIWAEKLLADLGYIDDLRRSEKDAETAENRIRNLKDLTATLSNTGGLTGMHKLETFLEDITLDNERAEDKEPSGEAVTLITMHSCKGLEFPHVYVVGLEEGLLPHSRSKLEGTLDEERRLFYVAITRAMSSLTLSHCSGRKKYGQLMPCHPSTFLKELPEHLVQHADELAKQPVAAASGKDLFAGIRASLAE